MSGASISGMQQSLRSNRNILKNRHKPFEKHPAKEKKIHADLHFEEVTPETKKIFLEKLKEEKRREKIVRTFIWTVGLILVAYTFYLILT